MADSAEKWVVVNADGRYFSQIWFLCGEGCAFDILASLYKVPDGEFEAMSRWRYYDGDQSKNAHEDGDTKNFYKFGLGQLSEKEALSKMNQILRSVADLAGLEIHMLPVRTADSEVIFKALSAQSWAHVAPPNESRSH